MRSEIKRSSSTEVESSVKMAADELRRATEKVFDDLRRTVHAPGFRLGKAPNRVVEKELGSQTVQTEVVKVATSELFGRIIKDHNLRPLGAPHVDLKKFVPNSELELVFRFEVMPEIKLANYKKITKTKPQVGVAQPEVERVIESLRLRAAKRDEVKRTARRGDEVIIDMNGMRDGAPVPGTKASNYAVVIGSKRFVPGFEEALAGLKSGQTKQFDVTFPKDYPEPTLQDKKIHFKVKVHKVYRLTLPAIDEEFAAQVGPFKSLAELKRDIERQIKTEKTRDRQRQLTDEIVGEVVDKSKLDLPKGLIQHQLADLWSEFEANLKSQRTDLEAYLKAENKSRQEIEGLLEKEAARRVKTALVLSEIARQENLTVSLEELEVRLQLLRGRYQDAKMRQELDSAHSRRHVADQLLVEKTVSRLVDLTSKSG